MTTWTMLIAGGLLGTLARYLLSGAVYRWLGAGFPYGTLVVNLTGCFVIGALSTVANRRAMLTPEVRLFCMVGFLGAFTTFSSLIYESARLLQDSQFALAAVNLLGSVLLGLAAFWLGMVLASVV